MFLIFPAI
jgi:hypothetical protein